MTPLETHDTCQEIDFIDLDDARILVLADDGGYFASQVERHSEFDGYSIHNIDMAPPHQRHQYRASDSRARIPAGLLDRGANGGVAGDELIGNDIMNDKNACGADLVVSLLTADKVMMRKSDGDDGSIFRVDTTAIGKDHCPTTLGFGKGYCPAALGFGRYPLQSLNLGASAKFIEATNVDSSDMHRPTRTPGT